MRTPQPLKFAILIPFILAFFTRCTPAETQQIVRDVLNVADYACITANVELPNAAVIAIACNLEKTLEPVIAKVVADFSAKRAKYAALTCAQAPKK